MKSYNLETHVLNWFRRWKWRKIRARVILLKNMEIFPCSNYYLRKIKASSCREDSLEVKRSRFNCFVPGFFYLDNKSKQKSEKIWYIRKTCYLCSRIGSAYTIRVCGLKGNRVWIPDSPAAVKLRRTSWNNTIATGSSDREGFKMGVSQKTCHSLKAVFARGIRKAVRKDKQYLKRNKDVWKGSVRTVVRHLNGR